MAELGLPQKMLLIMVTVMVFLGLVDYAIGDVGGSHFFNFNSTMGATFTDDGTLTGNFNADYEAGGAPAADTVDEDTGNVFTDVFKSVRGWLDKMEARFGLASSILRQPAGFMRDIGIPNFIVNAFAIIWYVMATMALIMFMAGRT